MRSTTRRLVLSTSLSALLIVGMGVSLPSCPGQQAMQQQLDTLQNSLNEESRKVQQLNQQVSALTNDMGKMRDAMTQAQQLLQTHEGQVQQLTESVKIIQASPPGKKVAPSSKAKSTRR